MLANELGDWHVPAVDRVLTQLAVDLVAARVKAAAEKTNRVGNQALCERRVRAAAYGVERERVVVRPVAVREELIVGTFRSLDGHEDVCHLDAVLLVPVLQRPAEVNDFLHGVELRRHILRRTKLNLELVVLLQAKRCELERLVRLGENDLLDEEERTGAEVIDKLTRLLDKVDAGSVYVRRGDLSLDSRRGDFDWSCKSCRLRGDKLAGLIDDLDGSGCGLRGAFRR